MNTEKFTDFLVHIERNHHDPVFHGVAQLFLLARQKCYSSQILKPEQINEVSNWMSYCIPHLQGRCSVSEMPRNLNVQLFLFRPWCYSLDHESKICEKMRLCERQFIFTYLFSCSAAPSKHKWLSLALNMLIFHHTPLQYHPFSEFRVWAFVCLFSKGHLQNTCYLSSP